MAQPVERGRDRIDYKGYAALVDALKDAADRRGIPFMAYLTMIFQDHLRGEGLPVPQAPPQKRLGRPRGPTSAGHPHAESREPAAPPAEQVEDTAPPKKPARGKERKARKGPKGRGPRPPVT